jgi:hypothetical protein
MCSEPTVAAYERLFKAICVRRAVPRIGRLRTVLRTSRSVAGAARLVGLRADAEGQPRERSSGARSFEGRDRCTKLGTDMVHLSRTDEARGFEGWTTDLGLPSCGRSRGFVNGIYLW